jgi:hypothetical protein
MVRELQMVFFGWLHRSQGTLLPWSTSLAAQCVQELCGENNFILPSSPRECAGFSFPSLPLGSWDDGGLDVGIQSSAKEHKT